MLIAIIILLVLLLGLVILITYLTIINRMQQIENSKILDSIYNKEI